MAPPEPEWMLWAKRLRDENKVLLQRIDSKPESSALELLAEEMRSLATTIQHLQQDNHTLRQRIQELERNVSEREQVMGEKVQELGRSMTETKNELNLTVEVVEMIREGGGLPSYQKYVRRPSSRPQQRTAAKITYRTRAASKALSQATTTDDNISGTGRREMRMRSRYVASRGINGTERICYRMTPPDGHIPESQEARARDRYAALEAIGVDPQGNKTLEEYFRDGAGSVVRAMQLYENRAAKAFVCGMRDKHRRMELWERLTEQGWTWQQLRKEMQWMLESERRRKGGRKVSLEL